MARVSRVGMRLSQMLWVYRSGDTAPPVGASQKIAELVRCRYGQKLITITDSLDRGAAIFSHRHRDTQKSKLSF
jgi:hypothetical protein